MSLSGNAKAIGQRMVRAAASTMLSVGIIGGGFNAFGGVDYKSIIGVGLGASIVSLLMSLAGTATSGNGPAFGDTEQTTP